MKLIKVAIVILIIGTIGSLITALVFSKDIKNYYYGEQQKETYLVSEIDDIEIDVNNRNLIVLKSDDDDIHLSYYVEKNETKTLSLDNKKLSFSIDEKWINKIISSNMRSSYLFQGDYLIVTLSVPESINKLALKSDNGRIEVSNLSINDGVFKTSNGRIVLNDVVVKNNINLNTSNGRVEIENSLLNNVNLKTSNGQIIFNKNVFSDAILKTSNGRIYVTLLDEFENYQTKARTSNGKIFIDGNESKNESFNSGASKRLELNTSNGRITIQSGDI